MITKFLIVYLIVVAFIVYINKGIGDMNARYDKSIEEAVAEKRRRELE